VILALLLAGCREPERPNFLVIDLDTLRADRIGRARGGSSITPSIDELAARGVRFDQMIAQSGWTLPSLAALHTGQLPLGALERVPGGEVDWIRPDARTLAEILSLYGYRTAAFYGATVPSAFPVMKRGFAHGGEPPMEVPDGDAAREVVQWIGRSPKEPWFAFVHTADLHRMGEVPAAALDRYAPAHPPPCIERGSLAFPLLVSTWEEAVGRTAAEDLFEAHYDAVVRHYDDAVGAMLAAVDREGVRDRTVIVLLSDHGEELFERGGADHGPPYEFDLRVPLVVAGPTVGPRAVPTMVQTVDVAPTILELAGIPVDADMDGRSLVPLLRGTDGYVERPAISITDPHRISVRTPGWALLRCAVAGCARVDAGARPAGGPALELYDLVADPHQRTNLAGTGVPVEAELRALLDEIRPSGRRRRAPDDGASAEQERVLRERGYWDAREPSR
jgi:arylsulfatase A-like enzyme